MCCSARRAGSRWLCDVFISNSFLISHWGCFATFCLPGHRFVTFTTMLLPAFDTSLPELSVWLIGDKCVSWRALLDRPSFSHMEGVLTWLTSSKSRSLGQLPRQVRHRRCFERRRPSSQRWCSSHMQSCLRCSCHCHSGRRSHTP